MSGLIVKIDPDDLSIEPVARLTIVIMIMVMRNIDKRQDRDGLQRPARGGKMRTTARDGVHKGEIWRSRKIKVKMFIVHKSTHFTGFFLCDCEPLKKFRSTEKLI